MNFFLAIIKFLYYKRSIRNIFYVYFIIITDFDEKCKNLLYHVNMQFIT